MAADTVGDITTLAEGSTGFYGFIANGNFTTLSFNANFDTVSSNGDGFGADNFLYSSVATPVPFEFSPALGLGVLGTLWVGRRVWKKKKSK